MNRSHSVQVYEFCFELKLKANFRMDLFEFMAFVTRTHATIRDDGDSCFFSFQMAQALNRVMQKLKLL